MTVIDIFFGTIIPIMLGFVFGVFFGMALMAMMHSASSDSREKEGDEEWKNSKE